MRYVSPRLPATILASWIVVGLALCVAVAFQDAVFPDRPAQPLAVWMYGEGDTREQAMMEFNKARRKALSVLQADRFTPDEIASGPLDIHDKSTDRGSGTPYGGPRWTALAHVSAGGDSYKRLVQLTADVRAAEPSGRAIWSGFPAVPFLATLGWISVLLIVGVSFSVTALDTRTADVHSAPRGMHPVAVAAQTALYALFPLLSLACVHTEARAAGPFYAVVCIVGIGALAAWLYRSRESWEQSVVLKRAFIGYVTATAALTIIAVLTFHAMQVSPT